MEKNDIKNIIKNNLSYLRMNHNLTTYQMANLLTKELYAYKKKCHHSVIENWENGLTIPNLEILFFICKFFKVSINLMCGFKENDVIDFNIPFESIKKNIPKNIYYYRIKNKISREQLINEINKMGYDFSKVSLCQIEKGKNRPSIERLIAICQVLNVPVSVIMCSETKQIKKDEEFSNI